MDGDGVAPLAIPNNNMVTATVCKTADKNLTAR
jgi:hypothetical protein